MPINDNESSALDPQQNTVLNAIASGRSVSEAAKRAGVHRNTVNNWRRMDPDFAAMHEDAVAERTLYCRDKAQSMVSRALDVLNGLLEAPFSTPSMRLRAALSIIKVAEFASKPANSAPPAAKTQIMHSSAQSAPPAVKPQTLHNSAQSAAPRSLATEPCPCASGLAALSCCLKGAQFAQNAQSADPETSKLKAA